MSTTIDNAFVKQFEQEVHEAYQRMGSKLRSTVRNINDVNGSTAVFQKVGKGTASTKSTHGMVPVMNLAHSAVEVALQPGKKGQKDDGLDAVAGAIAIQPLRMKAGHFDGRLNWYGGETHKARTDYDV